MYSLDQIVRSGKVRYIGGSTMPAYKFAQMVMIADWKGYARPIAMQNLYNLVQREEEREMNRLCHEQGVGLILHAAGARLPRRQSRQGRRRRDRALEKRCGGQSRRLSRRLGGCRPPEEGRAGQERPPAQAALPWLLSKPYMGSPIIGATSLDQLPRLPKPPSSR